MPAARDSLTLLRRSDGAKRNLLAVSQKCASRDAMPIRSVFLTIFWRCSCGHFSSRNRRIGPPGNQPSTVLTEDLRAQKGLAMLIRGQIDGISGEVALAAATIPAALLPTLLLGGLLLTCP
ncbi:hypothetical protein DXU04_20555 [Bradyrhizobium diazoefficiens]|nr:hypothetical protein AF336_05705 [Bradyrhizobium diazoefficiens]PDT61334.1 hypothetical protein CO678_10275 [Bradyrhizobium diazoefficiens]